MIETNCFEETIYWLKVLFELLFCERGKNAPFSYFTRYSFFWLTIIYSDNPSCLGCPGYCKPNVGKYMIIG